VSAHPLSSELVAPAVREMTGDAALPRDNGELVFEAPWQGRALGLAVGLVEALDLEWDQFRDRLIAAIAADPDRPYYESWVTALADLAFARGVTTADELERRAGSPGKRFERGVGWVECFPLPVDETTLTAVLTDLFGTWWQEIRFGPAIQGAVFEARAAGPPRRISTLDGYVTVDFGDWHLHLCVGEHRGVPGGGVEPEVARHRRCSRAELVRLLHEDVPVSWSFRMFNGADEQQITVWLPNPFLDDDQRELDAPDWSRLACWDHLRMQYLGLEPDTRDRSAPRFHHG
jgi:hypothetical protein